MADQIVPVIMDSVSESVDYELDAILGGALHIRLQRKLKLASPEMDDVDPDNISKLQQEARQFIDQSSAFLKELCKALAPGRGSSLPGVGVRGAARMRGAIRRA